MEAHLGGASETSVPPRAGGLITRSARPILRVPGDLHQVAAGELVAEVAFQTWTADKVMRHVSCQGTGRSEIDAGRREVRMTASNARQLGAGTCALNARPAVTSLLSSQRRSSKWASATARASFSSIGGGSSVRPAALARTIALFQVPAGWVRAPEKRLGRERPRADLPAAANRAET